MNGLIFIVWFSQPKRLQALVKADSAEEAIKKILGWNPDLRAIKDAHGAIEWQSEVFYGEAS